MKRLAILALGVASTLGAGLVLAAAASAHVTVSAPGATSGGSDQEIVFRVPVEKDINTTGLTIQLPTNTPIASVLVEPIAGWSHTQTTSKLATPIKTDDGDITSAVSTITWKALDKGLAPGEFGEFTIIAGQLPDASSLTFKALQTYSDGSIVRWIETAAPGSSVEPEDPAPVLALAKASTASDASATDAPAATTTVTKSASNTGPIVLSVIALVLAAAALGLVVVSRARKSTA
jgi:uncharacterized protein YcnI